MKNFETNYDKEIRMRIIETLEEVLGVPREYWEIKRSKESDEVFIRQIYCYLLSTKTDFNLQKIASIIGFKHHASVMRITKQIADQVALDEPQNKINATINKFNELYGQTN
jgi:chromosomal replication initiation ATPase DnaA